MEGTVVGGEGRQWGGGRKETGEVGDSGGGCESECWKRVVGTGKMERVGKGKGLGISVFKKEGEGGRVGIRGS